MHVFFVSYNVHEEECRSFMRKCWIHVTGAHTHIRERSSNSVIDSSAVRYNWETIWQNGTVGQKECSIIMKLTSDACSCSYSCSWSCSWIHWRTWPVAVNNGLVTSAHPDSVRSLVFRSPCVTPALLSTNSSRLLDLPDVPLHVLRIVVRQPYLRRLCCLDVAYSRLSCIPNRFDQNNHS